ncbi:MAG: enoyl-CoA hydratase/isomerase family protein [Candidatus Hermodarchaeia archaeon]|jgi:enoyl-CoA hydratase
MTDYETITFAVEGHFLAEEEQIGVITLNRPGKLNAIGPELIKEMNDVLDKIEKDDNVRAVIIRSASEKAFSVGADLTVAAQMAQDKAKARKFMESGQALFRRIEAFPKPLIAEVHGLCMGGGLEMSLACDLRVASKEAKFSNPEVKLGLIPGWGGTQRLPRVVGMGRAKEIVLTGRDVLADEAFEMGLVNKVVPSDELHGEALFMAQSLADNAPIALKLAKEAMNSSFDVPVEKGNVTELDGMLATFETEDLATGIAAVFSKSKPKFKGK